MRYEIDTEFVQLIIKIGLLSFDVLFFHEYYYIGLDSKQKQSTYSAGTFQLFCDLPSSSSQRRLNDGKWQIKHFPKILPPSLENVPGPAGKW